jgi:hypothetical protein
MESWAEPVDRESIKFLPRNVLIPQFISAKQPTNQSISQSINPVESINESTGLMTHKPA